MNQAQIFTKIQVQGGSMRKKEQVKKSCWQESQQGQNECQGDSRIGGGKNKFVEEEVSMFL